MDSKAPSICWCARTAASGSRLHEKSASASIWCSSIRRRFPIRNACTACSISAAIMQRLLMPARRSSRREDYWSSLPMHSASGSTNRCRNALRSTISRHKHCRLTSSVIQRSIAASSYGPRERDIGVAAVNLSRLTDGLDSHRNCRSCASDERAICRAYAFSRRGALRCGHRLRGFLGARYGGGTRGAADRAAGLAVSFAPRCAVGCLPAAPRCGVGWNINFRRGLLPCWAGHGARPFVPAVPRVSCKHGTRAARGRCLCIHVRVGSDGARLLFPCHDTASHRRDPPRRFLVSAYRACRSARNSSVLRNSAGGKLGVDLRYNACGAFDTAVGDARLSACALWLWCKSRPRTAACVATRSASRGAFAGVGAHERRDVENRRLRHPARELRSHRHPNMVVGTDRARSRPVQCSFRCRVRCGADGYEAAPRVLLDREHGHRLRWSWASSGIRRTWNGVARRARTDRHALSLSESRVHEESVVPRNRCGVARDRAAQPRQVGWPHALHALDCVAHAHRGARDFKPATIERLRVRVALATGFFVDRSNPARLRQYALAAGGGGGSTQRRACGVRHGEILRRDLPRRPARELARQRARLRSPRAPRARVARRRLRALRPHARSSDRTAQRSIDATRRSRARPPCSALVVARAADARPRLIRPGRLFDRRAGGGIADGARGAPLLSSARTPQRAMELWFRAARRTHAGHCGRFRAARPACVSALLPHAARTALAI